MEDIRNSETYKKKYIKIAFKKYGITDYESILNNIYGENWDISIFIRDRNKFSFEVYIMLYFEELTITNGNLSHDIKDLYVRIRLFSLNDILQVGVLKGLRSTVTDTEVNGDYMHSHLPGSGINTTFEKFCLGTGPISNIQMLESNDDLMQYLLLINEYVKWESLEGRPHRYIENLNKSDYLETISSRDIKELLTSFTPSKLKFSFTTTGIEFKEDDSLEQQLFEHLKNNHSLKGCCFKNLDGKYLSENLGKYKPKDYPHTILLTFRNKEITYSIIKDEKKPPFIPNAPHPSITEALTTELSQTFKTCFIHS